MLTKGIASMVRGRAVRYAGCYSGIVLPLCSQQLTLIVMELFYVYNITKESAPRKQYKDYKDAVNDAIALSAKQPTDKFAVLKVISITSAKIHTETETFDEDYE